MTTKQLDDDAKVQWTAGGQHIATTARVLRATLRRSHPDWTDEQIEREMFASIASEGQCMKTGGGSERLAARRPSGAGLFAHAFIPNSRPAVTNHREPADDVILIGTHRPRSGYGTVPLIQTPTWRGMSVR
jgi:Rv0078B-related antitoxin